MRHGLMRLRASLHRVRWIVLFAALWFGAGVLGFRWGNSLPWSDAWLSAFYFEVQPGAMAQGYAFWGQSLIFGVCVALLMRELLENYIERCRVMAGFAKDHTIVIGYSHLGQRLVAHLRQHGHPYVLVDRSQEAVDDLLRAGEPVVVDDARTPDALPSANVAGARRLIVASNNIETALIVVKRARDANPKLEILARCNFDEFTDILEKLGADRVYSTSHATFEELKRRFDGAAA